MARPHEAGPTKREGQKEKGDGTKTVQNLEETTRPGKLQSEGEQRQTPTRPTKASDPRTKARSREPGEVQAGPCTTTERMEDAPGARATEPGRFLPATAPSKEKVATPVTTPTQPEVAPLALGSEADPRIQVQQLLQGLGRLLSSGAI